MDIRHLKYFIAIAEEGKILKAAKRLNISQPPLSNQLMQLERELGIKLFNRQNQRLTITHEGKLFYQRAKKILKLVEGTVEEFKELSEGIRGTLSIGSIATLGATLLPERIRDFQKRYPNVQFQVWEGDPNRIMELVANRIVEIGIVRLPINDQLFDMIKLSEEPLVVAMSKEWNIGEDRDYVTLSELEGKPLMCISTPKGTSVYNHSSVSNKVAAACLQNGIEPRVIGECSNITPLLTWALHDIGIAVVPQSAKNIIPNSGLIFKEIREPIIMTNQSALIWLKENYLSSISRKFIETFPLNNGELDFETN
ncbi:LysR family transcriptional regulator [Neobacillus niacini]|uniref:LysR family transcriptional regulator n=1 Tax=Neobacillus niacini TaxID=86668 RepID=UPI00300145F4